MTPTQVAKELGISRMTLFNWLRSGKVPGPAKLGKNRSPDGWTAEDVERVHIARKSISRPGRPVGWRKRLDPRRIAALRRQGLSWPAVADRMGACVPVVRREALRIFHAQRAKPVQPRG